MLTILIIDDDALFVDTVTFVLEQQEHRVLQASSGREGVAMAEKHGPDLVLCDVHMKDGHGYTTAQALRAQPATEHIPIIMMTGKASPFGEQRSKRSGANCYLAKPFTVTTLLGAIHETLVAERTVERSSDLIMPSV